jgi:hypothetical protein
VCTDDCYDLVQELADEIERLEAEVEHLRAILTPEQLEHAEMVKRIKSEKSYRQPPDL